MINIARYSAFRDELGRFSNPYTYGSSFQNLYHFFFKDEYSLWFRVFTLNDYRQALAVDASASKRDLDV